MPIDTSYRLHSRQVPYFDAFGRGRSAEPETLFDSKLLHDKLSLFWDEDITDTSGNATSTHSTANAADLEKEISMYVRRLDALESVAMHMRQQETQA